MRDIIELQEKLHALLLSQGWSNLVSESSGVLKVGKRSKVITIENQGHPELYFNIFNEKDLKPLRCFIVTGSISKCKSTEALPIGTADDFISLVI